MKKILFTALISILLSSYAFAQGTQIGSSPIYYNGDKVGIGTVAPFTKLYVDNGISTFNRGNSLGQIAAFRGLNSEQASIGTKDSYFLSNVGIGTTSPNGKLDIVKSVDNTSTISSFNNFSNDQLVLRNANTTAGAYAGIAFVGNANELLGRIGYKRHPFGNGRGEFFISVDDAGTVTEAMLIDKTGNIGIGSTNLTEKLNVDGTVRSRKVKVEAAGWPDYVFSSDYTLRPLNELEQFIEQNQHLPEVPSAKEIEANGLDLGDMEATLLKKIEELTLYTIQQEKRLETSDARYQTLDSKYQKLENENSKLKVLLLEMKKEIESIKKQ